MAQFHSCYAMLCNAMQCYALQPCCLTVSFRRLLLAIPVGHFRPALALGIFVGCLCWLLPLTAHSVYYIIARSAPTHSANCASEAGKKWHGPWKEGPQSNELRRNCYERCLSMLI